MVPYSVSSSCHSLKREVEMYFHFFLLMLHLCSFLLRELSCESRPYPPSSFSSRSSAPVRPGFCRSRGSPCRERRGGRVRAPVAGGRWSVAGGRWPALAARSGHPSAARSAGAARSSRSGFLSCFLDRFLPRLLRQLLLFSPSKWWTLPGFSTLLCSIRTCSLEDLSRSHDFKSCEHR